MIDKRHQAAGLICGTLIIVLTTYVFGNSTPMRVAHLILESQPAVRAAHVTHNKERMSCDACHKNQSNSHLTTDRNIPSMETCRPCHEKEVADGRTWQKRCGFCHINQQGDGYQVRGKYSNSRIKFSHHAHRAQSCVMCHGKSGNPDLSQISMKACYACHEKKKANLTACRTCHLMSPDGRLKTHWNDGVLIPPAWLVGPTHGIGWAGNHATQAGRDSKFCANCHRETECTNCHNGRIRRKQIHPSDWVNTHGTHSTMDNPRCKRCHQTQRFCLSCHRRSGVAPDAPTNRRGQKPSQFHGNASPAKICQRARTNITACASCHSESSCVTCHATINPHPVGFSKRCKPLARRNSRACAKCHNGDVEKLCR